MGVKYAAGISQSANILYSVFNTEKAKRRTVRTHKWTAPATHLAR